MMGFLHKQKFEGIPTQKMNAAYRCVPQITFQTQKSTDEGIPTFKKHMKGIPHNKMNATYRCVPRIEFQSKKQHMKGFLHKQKFEGIPTQKNERRISLCTSNQVSNPEINR